jgi:hypothetical protein
MRNQNQGLVVREPVFAHWLASYATYRNPGWQPENPRPDG